MRLRYSQRAATLMEVLVVVGIIAVLAAVGYSSYTRLKTESRRSDAHSSIIATQAIINRYLTENNKPTLDSSDLSSSQFANYSSLSTTPVKSPEGYYRITINTDSGGYQVSATATIDNTLTSCSSSANASKGQCSDLACRVIFIDDGQNGSQDSTGNIANASTTTCW